MPVLYVWFVVSRAYILKGSLGFPTMPVEDHRETCLFCMNGLLCPTMMPDGTHALDEIKDFVRSLQMQTCSPFMLDVLPSRERTLSWQLT